MEIYEGLVPGNCRFRALLDRLCNELDLGQLFSLADHASKDYVELLQYSIFTEHWRSFEAILAGNRSALKDLPTSHTQTETLYEVMRLENSAISRTAVRHIRKRLMTSRHPRNQNALLPRSKSVVLSSGCGLLKKRISPKTGVLWLNHARSIKQPIERGQRFFCGYLLALGLLCSHPFQNGNGRLSRVLLNICSPTSSNQPFPWSVYFLLRNGRHLYNCLLFSERRRFEDHLIAFLKTSIASAEQHIQLVSSASKLARSAATHLPARRAWPEPGQQWHNLIHS